MHMSMHMSIHMPIRIPLHMSVRMCAQCTMSEHVRGLGRLTAAACCTADWSWYRAKASDFDDTNEFLYRHISYYN